MQNLLQEEDSDLFKQQDQSPVSMLAMTIGNTQDPPLGALIIPDPIETGVCLT